MRLRVAKKVAKRREGGRQWRRACLRLYHSARRTGPPDGHHAVDWGDGLRPANLLQWAFWFEDVRNRIVAFTLRGRRGVSTVCLGLYHHPGWYESAWLTIDERGGRRYEPCARYDTRREAIVGHAQLAAQLPETAA